MLGVGLHVTANGRLLAVGNRRGLDEHLVRDVTADDFETFRASAPVNRPVPQGRSRMVRIPVVSPSALRMAAHLRLLRFWRSGVLNRWKS